MLNEKRKNIILFVSKRLFRLLFCLIFVSCTPKGGGPPELQEQKANIPEAAPPVSAEFKKSIFGKTLREAIYFSNSLEREALKLILKDSSFQKQTLFGVLSFVVETNSGAKKSTPFGLDCGQFNVRAEGKMIRVFKACVKPETEIANILTVKEDSLYEVEFLIKEWAGVVGLAVTLTGENLRCSLRIREKKLYVLNCANWSYQVQSDQVSSTVVKAREFVFQRDAKKQFVIRGGFFKELMENRKIDIVVPLEGKIKIIEKELLVIDEFANKLNEESRARHEKEEEYKKHIREENEKKAAEEKLKIEKQKENREGGQESNETESQTGQETGGEVSADATPANPESDSRGGRGR